MPNLIFGTHTALRLEQVSDEHSKRVQDCKHRLAWCDDSASRRQSGRIEFSERTRRNPRNSHHRGFACQCSSSQAKNCIGWCPV